MGWAKITILGFLVFVSTVACSGLNLDSRLPPKSDASLDAAAEPNSIGRGDAAAGASDAMADKTPDGTSDDETNQDDTDGSSDATTSEASDTFDATTDRGFRDSDWDGQEVSSGAVAEAGIANGTTTFGSSPEWESFTGALLPGVDDAGEDLGPAREVCTNAQVPVNCPIGALQYGGSATEGWTANAGLSYAYWIWLANVNPTQAAGNVVAGFTKTFSLGDHPVGDIVVGADDYAEVFVNGVFMGSVGSTTDEQLAYIAQMTGQTIDITSALRSGQNTITVVGHNGPDSFVSSCLDEDCSYAQNTAGVVFAGTLSW